MTREQKIYRAAHLLASCAIALVLLLSGYEKILRPADFALSVYRFHLLPDALVNALAIYLPWLEIVCAAVLLLVPRWRTAALRLALALLALFTCAIAVNLMRGTVYGCGCFGASPLERAMGWGNILRNLALMLLALLALASHRRSIR